MDEVEFYYIALRFDRGISNFHKKNYRSSQLDFEWLIKQNPDNELYKSWLYGLKSRKYDFILKVLFYIVVGAMVFTTFVDRNTNAFIYDLILYAGALSLVVAVILEIIKYINKRKTKNLSEK